MSKTRNFAEVIKAKLAADPALNMAVEYEMKIMRLEQSLYDAELRGVRAGLEAAAKFVAGGANALRAGGAVATAEGLTHLSNAILAIDPAGATVSALLRLLARDGGR